MFTALSERLTATLKRLTGRGVLSEQDVTEALREIRRHLLEADVSFEVTTGFVERVRERAVGVIAVKSVSPGQQVAKLVHDELARMLGASDEDLARTIPDGCRRSGPAGGSRGGEGALPHGHRRHGRPAADRRGADGRAQGAAGGDDSARGLAGGGWDDGAGRRADRPRLSGGRRADRRDSDQARR